MGKADKLIENPSTDDTAEANELINSYHTLMTNLSSEGTYVRYSRKPSLDYFYTTIMMILEAVQNRKIVLSKSICAKLVESIIKK